MKHSDVEVYSILRFKSSMKIVEKITLVFHFWKSSQIEALVSLWFFRNKSFKWLKSETLKNKQNLIDWQENLLRKNLLFLTFVTSVRTVCSSRGAFLEFGYFWKKSFGKRNSRTEWRPFNDRQTLKTLYSHNGVGVLPTFMKGIYVTDCATANVGEKFLSKQFEIFFILITL